MKNTLGNYSSQANKDFPVDAQTYESLQGNITLVSLLGNIAGDKAILLGCELEQNNTRRKEGYVFIRTREFPEGEILFWEGGAIGSGMYLKKEAVPISAEGYEFSLAYTVRSLAPGIGSENYSWNDLKAIPTIPQLERKNADLQEEIAKLTPPPLGIVQLWAGATVPAGYEFCEGQQLKTAEHPELYAALGTRYNNGYDCNGKALSTTSGYFRLPDLRGRFIAGYNPSDTEYNTYGKVGGEKKHQLTTAEIPAHAHGQNLWAGADGRWKGGGNNSWPNATSDHSQTTLFGNTASSGGGSAHETRPPYYVLAYIMRVK